MAKHKGFNLKNSDSNSRKSHPKKTKKRLAIKKAMLASRKKKR